MNIQFSELLRNPYFDAIMTYIVLGVVGLVYPSGWIFLFSIFFSFVLSDIILNFFIRGNKGWSKILTNEKFACKGHAYLVFLLGIIIGTILSSFVAEWVLQYAQSQLSWITAVLLTDFIVVGAVLGDLLWRFY